MALLTVGGMYPVQAAADKEQHSNGHFPTIIYGRAQPPYTEENSPYRKNTETEKLGNQYIKLSQDIKTTYDTGKLPEDYSSLKDLSDAVLNLPYINIYERSQLTLSPEHKLDLAYVARNELARLLMKKTVEGLISNQDFVDTLIILNKQANERLAWTKSVIADPNVLMTGTLRWDHRDMTSAEYSLDCLQGYLVDALVYTLSQKEIDLNKVFVEAGYKAQDAKKIIEIIKSQKTLQPLPSSPLKRSTNTASSELDKKYEDLKNWAKYHQMYEVDELVKEFLKLPVRDENSNSIDYDILYQKYRVREFITAMPLTILETPYRGKQEHSEIAMKHYLGGLWELRRFSNEGDSTELGMNEKEFYHYTIQAQISLLKQLRDRLKLAQTLLPKYNQKVTNLEQGFDVLRKEQSQQKGNNPYLVDSIFRPKWYALQKECDEHKSIKYNIEDQINTMESGIKSLQDAFYANLRYVYPQKKEQLKLLLESGASQQEAKELLK